MFAMLFGNPYLLVIILKIQNNFLIWLIHYFFDTLLMY